ncbi:MAG: polysaccharide deacetylase family protein [Alteraurantiacibacter sp.]
MRRLTDPPPQEARARFRDRIPRFILTIDTEEEFDWSQPLSRDSQGTAHVRWIGRFQQFCEREDIVPVYLVDWPIANSPLAADILREPLADGRAEVGVQLHPWVNPPHEEEVTEVNSFAGNLPRALEAAKLSTLRDAIEANLGVAPLIYRAGRYGVGPHTAELLAENGIAIDSSVRAKFDYSRGGGPNFHNHPVYPYWLDDARTVLELPLTTAFWGLLREKGDALFPRLESLPRVKSLLARTGMLERVPLTPEGTSVSEAIRGVDIALDDGVPLLVFSFHSPSLHPGYTPYVRDEGDLDTLYKWWRAIFAYLRQRGIRRSHVGEIMQAIER